MKIVFLGTGGMVPTKERNVTSIFLDYDGEGILVDCGEGTQRQMNIAGINRLKVKKILISHWHGDHVSGLVGLIQTLGNVDEPKPLQLFGPVGTKKYLGHVLNSCSFDLRIPIDVVEVDPKDDVVSIFENDKYEIVAGSLKHRIPCVGYSFIEKDQRKIQLAKLKKFGLKEGVNVGRLQRGETVVFNDKTIMPEDVSYIKKGRKATFVLDTEPCDAIGKLAKDSQVFICEANFASVLEDKADNSKHMTAQTAAQIASQVGARKLILTHFSQRYKTVEEVEEDARKIFPDSDCAYDFMKIKL